MLGAWAISHGGSDAQKARILPRIVAADIVLALAVDEQAKHRPHAISTRATREGVRFRIDGTKRMVIDAHVADVLIVAARTEGEALTLFMVDAGATGVAIERTQMVDAHNAGLVHLSEVVVGPDAVLGEVGGGADVLERILDVGRVVIAAQLLGVASEAFDGTVTYLKQRTQFGRLIGEFQALQHRAAMLYCDIEMTRAIVLKALRAVAAGTSDAHLLTSQAKARAGWTANAAVQEAVQMHGGMGMTDELDIGLFMKRARVLEELLGDGGFHADRVATLGGY